MRHVQLRIRYEWFLGHIFIFISRLNATIPLSATAPLLLRMLLFSIRIRRTAAHVQLRVPVPSSGVDSLTGGLTAGAESWAGTSPLPCVVSNGAMGPAEGRMQPRRHEDVRSGGIVSGRVGSIETAARGVQAFWVRGGYSGDFSGVLSVKSIVVWSSRAL